MSAKFFARSLVAMFFLGWLSTFIYGHYKYEVNYTGDNSVCGVVGTMKTYEQMVSGKHGGKIISGVTANVDFGSKYGNFIMSLPDSIAFQGEGTQYCVTVREIDRSVRVPTGWDVFLFLTRGLFWSILVTICIGIVVVIFSVAFGDDESE